MDVREAIQRSKVRRATGSDSTGVVAFASVFGVVLTPGRPSLLDADPTVDNIDTYPWSVVNGRADLLTRINALTWMPEDPHGVLSMIADASK
jgi:hypothetical protein